MARTCCRAFVRPDSKIIISIGEEKHLKNGLAEIPSAKPSYQPRSAELPFTCNPATGSHSTWCKDRGAISGLVSYALSCRPNQQVDLPPCHL